MMVFEEGFLFIVTGVAQVLRLKEPKSEKLNLFVIIIKKVFNF